MIPLVHDLSGETVLIFGGGPVGLRRARRFTGPTVIVLSPVFDSEDLADVTLVRAAPGPEDVEGWIRRTDPALVVAATDDAALNDAIDRVARGMDVMSNRADRPGGDVLVPATVRDDPVLVAISTEGQSPALARALRRRIEDAIDGAGAVATVCAELRAALRADDVDPDERRELLRTVVESDRVWTAARRGSEPARSAMESVLAEARSTDGA